MHSLLELNHLTLSSLLVDRMSCPSTEWDLVPAVLDIGEASGFNARSHELSNLHGVSRLSEGGFHLGAEIGEKRIDGECSIVAADIDYRLHEKISMALVEWEEPREPTS